jgi:hypothetical protein
MPDNRLQDPPTIAPPRGAPLEMEAIAAVPFG